MTWPDKHSNSKIDGYQERNIWGLGDGRQRQKTQRLQPLGGTGHVHVPKNTTETIAQHIEESTAGLRRTYPRRRAQPPRLAQRDATFTLLCMTLSWSQRRKLTSQ